MEIEIELTLADWQRFHRYLLHRKQKTLKGFVSGGARNHLVVFVLLALIFMTLFAYLDRVHWPTAFFVGTVAIVVMALFLINLLRLQRALAPSEGGPFVGRHRFVFDSQGIHTAGDGYRSFHEWRIVKAVTRNDGLIMLFLDTTLAFILPEERLTAPDEVFDLVRTHVDPDQGPWPEKGS